MVFARCRDVNDLALHCLYKRRILSLWVNNDNIGIGIGQNDVRHFFLCCKGFACTRYAEDKGITVEQVTAIGDNHILADYILPVINAVLVINFLHPKRNENRKAFRSKGTQGVNFSHAKGQHRIQSVHLLIFQHGKLTQVLSGSREQRFGVAVKLLLAVSRMHHSQHGEHHSLVTGRKVIKEFLAFFSLLLQVIRHNGRKVVVLILLSLPIRDIGFHAEQSVFHLSHGFICGNGDNVNREHHISVQLTKLRYHTVLDIGGVFSEENHTPVSVAHSETVLFKFKGVGADKVLEVVTLSHRLGNIETERRFFACAVKVVKNAELFLGFKLYAA